MGNSLVQGLHHIALILVLSMSRQRFSVSRISTVADSVCSITETQELGTRSCQNNALKNILFNTASPPPSTVITSCLLVLYFTGLELLERKQLRNAATLMPRFPLTVMSGMHTGK